MHQPNDSLLTRAEAAQRLRLSLPSLNRRFRDGSIPRTKIGGKTFVRESVLIEALDRLTTAVAARRHGL